MGSYQNYQENVPRSPVFTNARFLYEVPRRLPFTEPVLENVVPEPEPEIPWLLRLTNWLGVTMMAKTDTPHGNWSFNPATVTLALVVIGLIAGGAYWVGQRDADNRHLIERIQKAEDDARRAKDLSISAASAAGHQTNTNTKTEGHK